MSNPATFAGQADEARYQAFITKHSRDWDRVESTGWPAGALVIFLVCAAKGVMENYLGVFVAWCCATLPWIALPGLVDACAPAFYNRHREAVVVASKLLCVTSYPSFRLSWHAPGAPPDVKAAFGTFWARLPVHPLAAVQCGAVTMMGLSIRHSLRFKAQLLCQLAMLVVAMQAEAAAHRAAASPQQHFLSLRNATLLQVVCGTLWQLVQHYRFDSRRRKLCQLTYQRQQQWTEEGVAQQAPPASGAARRRRQSEQRTAE